MTTVRGMVFDKVPERLGTDDYLKDSGIRYIYEFPDDADELDVLDKLIRGFQDGREALERFLNEQAEHRQDGTSG